MWIGLAAGAHFGHDAGGVVQVEHRHAPHLPVGVAGMRVVGELDAHGPFLAQAIFDLRRNLRVGEIGQEGEGALGYAHRISPSIGQSDHTATAVGT